VSILLISLLILNVSGYYFWFLRMGFVEDQRLENQIDQNRYNELGTLVIKTAVMLPYENNEHSFMPVSGRLEIQGRFYIAVKHRIFRDTVYTEYIPNTRKNSLFRKFSEAIRFLDGTPVNGQREQPFPESIQKEYLPCSLTESSLGTPLIIYMHVDPRAHSFPQRALEIIDPPPRQIPG